ncbi:MAG: hypothetical protein HY681_12640, partial [Chloroflexi bacterium]|nr:hypothetical protein [Chloroflexota bacterium]
VSPIYAGISHKRLVQEMVYTLRPDPVNPLPTQLLHSEKVSRGLQWPCPASDAPGAAVLYAGGFPRGKARLMPILPPPVVERASPEFPLLFAPGRVLAQRERDMTLERVGGVNHIRRDELVEVHPEDASGLGLQAGDMVEVVTPRERLRGKVAIAEGQLRGVIGITTLFGELAVRLQASEDPDPMAKTPLLAVRPARLEKAT